MKDFLQGAASGKTGVATAFGTATVSNWVHEVTSSALFADITLISALLLTFTLIIVNVITIFIKTKEAARSIKREKDLKANSKDE